MTRGYASVRASVYQRLDFESLTPRRYGKGKIIFLKMKERTESYETTS